MHTIFMLVGISYDESFVESYGIFDDDEVDAIIATHPSVGGTEGCEHDISTYCMSDEDYMVWKLTGVTPYELMGLGHWE